MWDDGNSLGPKEVHNYLTRLMYNRRNKFNPLWNSLVLGGVKNGQKYLGSVNLLNHYVILIKSIYIYFVADFNWTGAYVNAGQYDWCPF